MRIVVATAHDEPFSVHARLVAYASYAQAMGHDIVITTTSPQDEDGILDLSAFRPTVAAPVIDLRKHAPSADDLVMFSAPRMHRATQARYGIVRPRFLHLVQSALAASAVGDVGYGYRLFQKPMHRIVTCAAVHETIARLVGPAGAAMERIEAGFDLSAFEQPVNGDLSFTVAINAFDGALAGRAIDAARERGFNGRLVVVCAGTAAHARAAAYRRATLLMAVPRLGEGVCQPASEAMAAGAALLMADCEALRSLPDGAVPVEVVRQNNVESMAAALLRTEKLAPEALLAHREASRRAVNGMIRDAERVAATSALQKLLKVEVVS